MQSERCPTDHTCVRSVTESQISHRLALHPDELELQAILRPNDSKWPWRSKCVLLAPPKSIIAVRFALWLAISKKSFIFLLAAVLNFINFI